MSFLEFLTAIEYWEQSEIILADTSITAMMLAVPVRPSMMQAMPHVGTAVTHCRVDTNSYEVFSFTSSTTKR